MSAGHIQRGIREAFEQHPNSRFTSAELAARVFPGVQITVDHMRAVNRTLRTIKAEIGLHACRAGHLGSWRHVWGLMSQPSQLAAIGDLTEMRDSVVSRDTLDFETRFTAPSDTGEIEGTAVRFNVVDSYRTEFSPDAFRGLEGRSVPMLWSHDPANVIGSWSTFQVRDDGLTARGKLNLSVAKAQEVRALLQAGDVRGLSIGFSTVKDERQKSGVRRIMEASLHEVSIVAFPSVPGSRVTAVRMPADLAALTTSLRAAVATLKG